MLPAPHRLRADADFTRLMKNSRRFFTPSIMARVARTGGPHTRFAFVVSTKVSKRATARNTVKRRMREIVRALLPGITPGFDVLLSVKPDILKKEFEDLRIELTELLRKTTLLDQSHESPAKKPR